MHTKATVPNFGEVWFDEQAITNIFSFAEMEDKFPITYDSDKELHAYHGETYLALNGTVGRDQSVGRKDERWKSVHDSIVTSCTKVLPCCVENLLMRGRHVGREVGR